MYYKIISEKYYFLAFAVTNSEGFVSIVSLTLYWVSCLLLTYNFSVFKIK